MKKMLLTVMIIVLVIFGALGAYALREIGASPSAEEIKSYEKLSYFRNGEFQSPQQMVYDFDNVRNGPAGMWRFLSRSPFAPARDLPQVALSRGSFPEQPEDFTFYWLGHSSAIMDINGVRLLFDPVLGNAAPIPFAVPRYGKAPIDRNELPPVDYVVITHNHYDHLERATVQALKNRRFIVPLGVGAALRGWGVPAANIIELGWKDNFADGSFKITAETAVHYSGRGLGGRNKTLWNSYVIQSGDKKVYWAGDSGYGEHFAAIGREYGPFDLAAIEIDGWNTGWPNTHMFPHEAVQAAVEVGARQMIPVHWAVFDLALHPWHESIDMVLDEASAAKLPVLTPQMGEKVIIGKSRPAKWW